MGRPSDFTPEIAAEICERLSKGEPLARICRDEHMPSDTTVRNWQKADEAFSSDIARARESGFDALAAECLDIADDDSRDWEAVKDSTGQITGVRVDGEHVQRSKVKIETRLKLLAKWDPKRYGERVTQEHTGPDGGPVQVQRVERVIVRPNAPDTDR